MLKLWWHPCRDASLSCVTTQHWWWLGLIWITRVCLRTCDSCQTWSTCWFKKRRQKDIHSINHFTSYFLLYKLLHHLIWTAVLLEGRSIRDLKDDESLGISAFKYFSVLLNYSPLFPKTHQLFFHLHNCILRKTQIIWTKCSVQSVGTVVKVDSKKQLRVILV